LLLFLYKNTLLSDIQDGHILFCQKVAQSIGSSTHILPKVYTELFLWKNSLEKWGTYVKFFKLLKVNICLNGEILPNLVTLIVSPILFTKLRPILNFAPRGKLHLKGRSSPPGVNFVPWGEVIPWG
jgi:hypothetical protein